MIPSFIEGYESNLSMLRWCNCLLAAWVNKDCGASKKIHHATQELLHRCCDRCRCPRIRRHSSFSSFCMASHCLPLRTMRRTSTLSYLACFSVSLFLW